MGAVRKHGDSAVREATRKFDKVELRQFEVSAEEKLAARDLVPEDIKLALARAKDQIEKFHLGMSRTPPRAIEVSPGLFCRKELRPIERVGLYVPGGTAPLPSTVLMLGVPSALAGCSLRVLCAPPERSGRMNPFIVWAAEICGIEKLFKIGGAQAIAAMAYGTETVPKVDKIFGPGNAWVTEAKLRASVDAKGASCDMPAGPSEVLVIADEKANAAFVAADLLSQAEHGPDSQVILLTTDETLVFKVEHEIKRQLEALSRATTARASLRHCRLIYVASLESALEIANTYAPEHLILNIEPAEDWAARVKHAGSVFLGAYSPEAVGDYASGTNHVLPTYGYARSFSGLSVDSFQKEISFQNLSPAALLDIGSVAETIAAVEGLEAHAHAIAVRRRALAETGAGKKLRSGEVSRELYR
jgi:histidinol dehydrogenase